MKIFLAAAALLSLSISASAETWIGTLSDSRCGAKHTANTAADVECIKTCLKKGAVPVLVSDGKVLNVAAESVDKVVPHIGEKVSITGKIEREIFQGQFIVVESISKAE